MTTLTDTILIDSNFGNGKNCFLALDCSGPFTPDHQHRLQEVCRVLQRFDSYRFHVLLFGDTLGFSKTFTIQNVDEISDIKIIPIEKPKTLSHLFDHITNLGKKMNLTDPPRVIVVTSEQNKALAEIDETKFRLFWFIV